MYIFKEHLVDDVRFANRALVVPCICNCDVMERRNEFAYENPALLVSIIPDPVCGPFQINDHAIVVICGSVCVARIPHVNAAIFLRKTKPIGGVIFFIHAKLFPILLE